ncbi:MAG TPA: hypothetical protein VLK84_00810 [Longimicrobium sp.]|nr:hypothetical protein [Longimicrobium sp.]
MHEETNPQFSLAAIQAAVAEGNYYFMAYAAAGLVETQLTRGEIEQAIAALTPWHFHKCLLSTADGWEGQPFDWYICPYSRPGRTSARTGLSLKLVLEPTGEVRIFSLHWSKVPK